MPLYCCGPLCTSRWDFAQADSCPVLPCSILCHLSNNTSQQLCIRLKVITQIYERSVSEVVALGEAHLYQGCIRKIFNKLLNFQSTAMMKSECLGGNDFTRK